VFQDTPPRSALRFEVKVVPDHCPKSEAALDSRLTAIHLNIAVWTFHDLISNSNVCLTLVCDEQT